MESLKILFLDDDKDFGEFFKTVIEKEIAGCEVEIREDVEASSFTINETDKDIIFLDVNWGRGKEKEGIGILKKIKENNPMLSVFILTIYDDHEVKKESAQYDADGYIVKKDIDLFYIRNFIIPIIEKYRENKEIIKEVDKKVDFIGKSAIIRRIKYQCLEVADTYAPVLITGPTGSGKEVVAKYIYEIFKQKNKRREEVKYGTVNTTAITETLLESELFGHKKGSFTGAESDREGILKSNEGGCVFLDEIGDIPITTQEKLLRFLDSGEIRPVGSDNTTTVKVKVIMATNRDLKEEIKNGNFKEDLYYRILGLKIEIPPLNERREDIPDLIRYFLNKIKEELRNSSRENTGQITNYVSEKEEFLLEGYGVEINEKEYEKIMYYLDTENGNEEGRDLLEEKWREIRNIYRKMQSELEEIEVEIEEIKERIERGWEGLSFGLMDLSLDIGAAQWMGKINDIKNKLGDLKKNSENDESKKVIVLKEIEKLEDPEVINKYNYKKSFLEKCEPLRQNGRFKNFNDIIRENRSKQKLKDVIKFVYNHQGIYIEEEVLEYLKNKDWEGNVRELKNFITPLVVMAYNKGIRKITLFDVYKMENRMKTDSVKGKYFKRKQRKGIVKTLIIRSDKLKW